jgi:Mor family transcriptional regulator
VSDLLGFDGDPLDLIERDDGVDESQWAPLLADMVRVIEADKVRRGVAQADAFADARNTVLVIAEYFGGRQAYLPKGDRLKTALRDAEIWRKFTGKNARELAAEHGVSEIHMYAILKRQRALHTRKLQGRLFPD